MKKLMMLLSCAVIMNVSALNTTAKAVLEHEQDYQISGAYLKAKIQEGAARPGVEAFRSDVVDPDDGEGDLFGIEFKRVVNGVIAIDDNNVNNLPYAEGHQRCQGIPDQQIFVARWFARPDQNEDNDRLWGFWTIRADDFLPQGCVIWIDPQW